MKKPGPARKASLIRSGLGRRKILLRSNIILLVALFLMIFILPIFPATNHQLTKILLSIIVISGLFAAEFSKRAFHILLSLGSLVILVTALSFLLHDSPSLLILNFLLYTLFFIMVTIALVAHVAGAREVFGSTVLCAVNSYLLVGLVLSILFFILDTFVPGSFPQVDSEPGIISVFIYYSFVTLTTLGYGDITPQLPLARSLSVFTALLGQLYMVIIMAIIIGKYLIYQNKEK